MSIFKKNIEQQADTCHQDEISTSLLDPSDPTMIPNLENIENSLATIKDKLHEVFENSKKISLFENLDVEGIINSALRRCAYFDEGASVTYEGNDNNMRTNFIVKITSRNEKEEWTPCLTCLFKLDRIANELSLEIYAYNVDGVCARWGSTRIDFAPLFFQFKRFTQLVFLLRSRQEFRSAMKRVKNELMSPKTDL
jgi:hypothetical protein